MAVKRLLRQTLSHDEEMIEVHSLAELILSEGVRLAAGSSIKTDGEESDPWGLVGVVDIAKHRVRLHQHIPTRAADSGIGESRSPAFLEVPPRFAACPQSYPDVTRTIAFPRYGLPTRADLLTPPAQPPSTPHSTTVQDAPQRAGRGGRGEGREGVHSLVVVGQRVPVRRYRRRHGPRHGGRRVGL